MPYGLKTSKSAHPWRLGYGVKPHDKLTPQPYSKLQTSNPQTNYPNLIQPPNNYARPSLKSLTTSTSRPEKQGSRHNSLLDVIVPTDTKRRKASTMEPVHIALLLFFIINLIKDHL
jgi:hypothetical protein